MFRPALLLGTAIWLAGCSIQRDQPDFVYPDTHAPADAPAPELQPTENLILAPAPETDRYSETISAVEARKNALLRRAQQLSETPL
jgi:hypothetical protein